VKLEKPLELQTFLKINELWAVDRDFSAFPQFTMRNPPVPGS
jgi:hypothetical protein